jgi:hypothetical protein
MSQRTLHLLFPLLLTAALVACGGGNPTPNPNPQPGNQTRARLVACPVISQSADPTASACLAGTYTGKTLANADCKLVIEAGGNYRFTSPALTYSYTATPESIRVFDHQNAGGQHQLMWLLSDPVKRGDTFDLKFSYADVLGKQLVMEGTRRTEAGGQTSANCTATLN